MMFLLVAALVSVSVVLGAVWVSRDRAARRLDAALDVYARRELARARRRRKVARAAL
jgi:hypothetical protein